MKNVEKKVVALVLALVMICSMSVAALAEEVATVTDLLPVEETTVASDPVDDTVIEVTEDVTTDEPGFVFTGRVGVRMLNTGDIYLGDTVVLQAVVVDANAEYTISWEVCKDGLNWEAVAWGMNSYSFVVTRENAGYEYRAVLTVAE